MALLNNILLQTTTEIRSILRSLRLTKYLAVMRDAFDHFFGRVGYEFKFDKFLLKLIQKGDIIWDVGSNVGLYTEKFSELVGSTGFVYSFEPAPACFGVLQKNFSHKDNVHLVNIALGNTEGVLPMSMDVNPLGVAHSLVRTTLNPDLKITKNVNVMRGDDCIRTMQLPAPDIIKIDTEGFEEEVLLGLQSCLKNIKCRAVVCEIHFSILKNKGEKLAPVRIQKMLQDAGFKVKWIDASHLGACR